MDAVGHFHRRLAETIAWCAAHDWAANPAAGLRTAVLRPEFTEDGEIIWDWKTTPHQRQEAVEQLAVKRAKVLHEQNILPFQVVPLLRGGRLLAFNPDHTLSDGAASNASDGFFDGDNVPAWDTWITYVMDDPVRTPRWPWIPPDAYLLSWVPEPLVEVVTASIEVNPEECLLWATDLTSAFIYHLRQVGLVQ